MNRKFNSRLLLIPLILSLLILAPVGAEAQQRSKSKAKTTQSSSKKKTGSATSKKKAAPAKKSSKKATPKKNTKPETSADVKKRQAETQKEIARTKEEIRKNEAEVKKGLNELSKLRGDIDKAKQQVASASAQVKTLDDQIGSLETEITSSETQLEKMRADYLRAVKKIRESKNTNSDLAFIFSSKNFGEALRRMRYLRQFSDWRKRKSSEIAQRVETLKDQREQLAVARKEKDAALGKEVAARNLLDTRYKQQDALVVDLRKNGKALQSHLAKKQAEANDLRNRISALIAEEQRKAEAERRAREEAERRAEQKRKEEEQQRLLAQQEAEAQKDKKESKKEVAKETKKDKKDKKKDNKKTSNKDYAEARKRKPRSEAPSASSSSTADTKSSAKANAAAASAAGNFAGMRGSLPRPVAGAFRVTSQFGRHSLPELPDVMYDNPGIDAEVPAGSSAQAVYGGKVSGVYVIPGYSTVVIVNHGSYYTVYGNIASPAVKVGDVVKQGQNVGRLAAAEDDPSHSSIHFEVWKNREKLNPLDWIR